MQPTNTGDLITADAMYYFSQNETICVIIKLTPPLADG